MGIRGVIGNLYLLNEISFSSDIVNQYNFSVHTQSCNTAYAKTDILNHCIIANSFNEKLAYLSLWHTLLGHPSDAAIHYLPFSFQSNDYSKHCSICPLAKQTRISFPTSLIQTCRVFEFFAY